MKDGEDGKVRYKTLPALRRQYQCYWTSRGDQVSFMDMLEQEPDTYVADVTPDELAFIRTTSGSTGFPKLIPRIHAQLMSIAYRYAAILRVLNSDIDEAEKSPNTIGSVSVRPSLDTVIDDETQDKANNQLSSVSQTTSLAGHPPDVSVKYSKIVLFNNGKLGWGGGWPWFYMAAGVTRVMLDDSTAPPDDLPETCWTVICQERCRFALVLPYHIHQILSRLQLLLKSSWKCRAIFSTGQPIHKGLVSECLQRMADYFVVTYGISECGVLASRIISDTDLYDEFNSGKPFDDVELKVVSDNMQEIPPGSNKSLEILARTSTTLNYYVGNEEATRKTVLADGWCRTGDVGYINDQDEVFVFCRTSFAITHGACIVYPGWLENRIKKHPAVREVMVVPVPDPVLHQELCACVLPSPETEVTEDELKQFCEDLFLTSREDRMTAVPRYFLFFSNFPTTATGKPCRRSMQSKAVAQLSK